MLDIIFKVELFVNKVGPYNNPDETYHFYTLPLCQPDEVKHKSMSLGEILKGDRLAFSQYSLKFKGLLFLGLWLFLFSLQSVIIRLLQIT